MTTANAAEIGERRQNSKQLCTDSVDKRTNEEVLPPRKRKKPRWTKQEKRERLEEQKQVEPRITSLQRRKRKEKKINEVQLCDSATDRYSMKKVLAQVVKRDVVGARRIRLIAGAVSYTGSVAIVQDEQEGDGAQVITTTQTNHSLIQNTSISSRTARIYVKPLLVLDINGVLCHRIRDKTLPPTAYREGLCKPIAMTKVVLRPQLSKFLEHLFGNFCVAIWTSAQAKTAKELVCNLIPQQLQNKLLFVWNQSDCKRTISKFSGGEEIIFHKDLSRVWQCFPLWSTLNTVLVDDSPQKSTDATRMNMVNPLPLHGKVNGHLTREQGLISDEDNVEQQQGFFDSLVDLWKTNVVVEHWEAGIDLSMLRCGGGLTAFLHEQSSESNMFWSSGHEDHGVTRTGTVPT